MHRPTHTHRRVRLLTGFVSVAALLGCLSIGPARADVAKLAEQLRKLDPNVLPQDEESRRKHQRALHEYVRKGLTRANHASTHEWRAVETKADWEAFRAKRLASMRKRIARFPEPPKQLRYRVTKTMDGDGFKIRNVVYESRPGLLVTANLYVPDPLPSKLMSAPAILIVHSHHNPKWQGELQDMGMTWARAGCYVLVPDQLGHGERRQHPFKSVDDYDKPFRVSRQDYYFRYNTGMQLHLIGDSLIGWMAWDNMRGIDLLFQQTAVDPKRVAILGSVAGGGDPAAVTAALDERIDAAVIFNYGGPQPETKFPLPDDAELAFNYAGSGSWESTRNIAHSAGDVDRFLPWEIVASIAPRALIYAHEFAWDKDRDPVWKRFQKIWGEFYGKRDKLASAHGWGGVRLSSREASHCNNIGKAHRKHIHPQFEKWLGIRAEEYSNRRPYADLVCMTDDVAIELGAKPMREVARAAIRKRTQVIHFQLNNMPRTLRCSMTLGGWPDIPTAPVLDEPRYRVRREDAAKPLGDGGRTIQQVVLDRVGVPLPVLIFRPSMSGAPDTPVVLMLAQAGKEALLHARAQAIATLLDGGAAVALIDTTGTGETRPGRDRERGSWSTSLSAGAMMLGTSVCGEQFRDVFALCQYLETKGMRRVVLWGDSTAPVNASDVNTRVPLRVSQPHGSEPAGATLALLQANAFGAASIDPARSRKLRSKVKAVYVNGGLANLRSILSKPFVHVPHDAVKPGMVFDGDVEALVAAIAPTPIRVRGVVNGVNQHVIDDPLREFYGIARSVYGLEGADKALDLKAGPDDAIAAARWVLEQLKREK